MISLNDVAMIPISTETSIDTPLTSNLILLVLFTSTVVQITSSYFNGTIKRNKIMSIT